MNKELPIYIVVGDADYKLIYTIYRENRALSSVTKIDNTNRSPFGAVSTYYRFLDYLERKKKNDTIESNTRTV